VEDDADFTRFVEAHRMDGGFAVPHPSPPPSGTPLRLEVVTKDTGERVCVAHTLVTRVVAAEGDRPSSMVLVVGGVDPGCSEDVRQALGQAEHASARGASSGAGRQRGRVIGIDLGTTYSCAAVVEGTEPKVLQSRLGYSTIPSIVTFDDQGLPVVGQLAERRLVLEPERVVYGSKRLIGRTYSKSLARLFGGRTRYEIVPDGEGMAAIKVGRRVLSPIEVGACVLAEMKKMAEAALHEPVNHAVITVPAAFTENQRGAVREAGARAGLEVLRIVNEPTAATLAFGYGRGVHKKVLVYDLGGGTFDVSILSLSGSLCSVLATVGDTFLGGLDFDDVLVQLMIKALREQHGDVRVAPRADERLRAAARDAKHALSETTRTNVSLPKLPIEGGAAGTVDFQTSITREQFEAAATPLVDRTIKTCDEALAIANLTPRDIEDVLLVGGQTRMPMVSARLQAHFHRPPSKRVHPDEVVACGAAILATTFERDDAPVLMDVLSIPIGIAEPDGTMQIVLGRNVWLPTAATLTIDVAPGAKREIAVFQGESMKAVENEFLGAFTYEAAPGDDATPHAIELTFLLNMECILTVRSKDVTTGVEAEHTLTTRQTSDEVLARLGRERLAPKLPAAPAPTPAPARSGVMRTAKAAERGPGLWAWVKSLWGG
jgi:molecular chaperone DnaK